MDQRPREPPGTLPRKVICDPSGLHVGGLSVGENITPPLRGERKDKSSRADGALVFDADWGLSIASRESAPDAPNQKPTAKNAAIAGMRTCEMERFIVNLFRWPSAQANRRIEARGHFCFRGPGRSSPVIEGDRIASKVATNIEANRARPIHRYGARHRQIDAGGYPQARFSVSVEQIVDEKRTLPLFRAVGPDSKIGKSVSRGGVVITRRVEIVELAARDIGIKPGEPRDRRAELGPVFEGHIAGPLGHVLQLGPHSSLRTGDDLGELRLSERTAPRDAQCVGDAVLDLPFNALADSRTEIAGKVKRTYGQVYGLLQIFPVDVKQSRIDAQPHRLRDEFPADLIIPDTV